jgi:hypothetical protein
VNSVDYKRVGEVVLQTLHEVRNDWRVVVRVQAMRAEVSVVPLEGSVQPAAMVGRAGFPGWAQTSLQLLSAETARN